MKKLIDRVPSMRTKLSGLWITMMLLYVYCDIYTLFRPGHVMEMNEGIMGPFTASQGMLVGMGFLMIIPTLMIVANLFLKSRLVRWLNIIVGSVYVLVNIGNIVGETWAYYIVFGVIEIAVMVLTVVLAARWPKEA